MSDTDKRGGWAKIGNVNETPLISSHNGAACLFLVLVITYNLPRSFPSWGTERMTFHGSFCAHCDSLRQRSIAHTCATRPWSYSRTATCRCTVECYRAKARVSALSVASFLLSILCGKKRLAWNGVLKKIICWKRVFQPPPQKMKWSLPKHLVWPR